VVAADSDDPAVSLQPHCFDDLYPGQSFSSGPRTITRADIDAFTELSGDRTALHNDESYAQTTPFGSVVAHGALVLSAGTGLAYGLGIFEGTVLAVRSMDACFERPVFPGDSISLRLEVHSKEEHPRPDRGRIRLAIHLTNQHKRTVLTGVWVLLLRRR
jgi:acyl dehydratase